jgi:hypothetical protein
MAKKEKVLILSYYFPPCNLTPSERIFSWARYLQKGDYYPIIITRNWDLTVTNSTTAAFQSSGDKVRIEKHDDYEVHYLPYTSSLKDKAFIKLDGTKYYFLYLILAFISNLTNLIVVKRSALSSFYYYTRSLLKQEQDIDKMIVSASPYELFGIAFHLYKFKPLKWIADYRDDWSTSEVYHSSAFKKLLNVFNGYYEKRWLSTCTSFISVSGHYVEKISRFIGKHGEVLTNGYMPENYVATQEPFDLFTITYVGSIYPTQPIELFLDGITSFIDSTEECQMQVYFVGIKNEHGIMQRIAQSIKGYEGYFKFTERVEKQEAIRIQGQSHLLLICSHNNLKGIPGSKLYEYIALRKNVIVYPSDGDIVENTLRETGQGIICHNMKEFNEHLNVFYTRYKQGTSNMDHFNEIAIRKYSREGQADLLIQYLHACSNKNNND